MESKFLRGALNDLQTQKGLKVFTRILMNMNHDSLTMNHDSLVTNKYIINTQTDTRSRLIILNILYVTPSDNCIVINLLITL